LPQKQGEARIIHVRPARFVVPAAIGVAVCGAAIAHFVGNSAGGADTSGYLNSARLLAQGRLSEPARLVPGVNPAVYPPATFVPLGMRPGRVAGTVVPVYPVGLPLHLAAASFLVGLGRAPTLVNTLAWMVSIMLVYRLARLMSLPRRWSAIAVVSFAVFPVTVLQSVRVMSDLLATTWCLSAVAFALRSAKRRSYAVVSGVSFAVAVLVRPTDVLVGPAVALAIGANPSALGLATIGAAPILAGLGLYNLANYGSALTTGYSGIGPLVSVVYLGRGLLFFGRWLGTFLGPLALFVVVVGVFLALRGDRRQTVLAAWSGALIVFYALYEPSIFYGWWRLRFLLPALPAMLVMALLAAKTLLGKAQVRSIERRTLWWSLRLALLGCIVWDLAASAYWVGARRLWRVGGEDDIYPRCVSWAESQVPANAAFLSMQTSGAIYYYGHHPIVRYDLLDDAAYKRFRADASMAGIPIYALLFRIDRLEFERRWPGEWERLGGLGEASLWRPRPSPVPTNPPSSASANLAPHLPSLRR
jgi:hypothetical protein